ncbi:TPA: type VI secretion protein VasK [Klebsiella aerogenes]|nr:type VI secretion protein VasK [Klebsiella aerogenes]HCS4218753.1 type VI secretion protein VasK [Klebsiella aerogenes]
MQKYSLLRLLGVAILVGVIGILAAIAIHLWGDDFGLTGKAGKVSCWFAFMFVFLCAFKLLRLNSYFSVFKRYAYATKANPSTSYLAKRFSALHTYRTPENDETNGEENRYYAELNDYLKQQYGYFWPSKVRILMVTGKSADVEQAIPGLIEQYWLEANGTVLLWDAELTKQGDRTKRNAVCKLRRQPDGVIWITSAFDQLTVLSGDAITPALSTMDIDSIAHTLNARYVQQRRRLPLYVWSLHPRAGERRGQITQSIGCLLPANCTPEQFRQLVDNLAGQLIARGIHSVSDSHEDAFLLRLAEQLTRFPESIVSPLSAFLSPARPLPLAGIMFGSQVQELSHGADHYWRKDNRWDVLLESLATLPAGLKAHKTGYSLAKIMTVISAVLMLLWGGAMFVSFAANRHLLVTAQEQVQRAAAQKQPLAERLHALAAVQKTLAQLTYRKAHGAPWYARAGLSQNDDLLAALYPRYGVMALPLVRDAAAEHLQQQLQAFVQLPPESPLRERLAKTAYNQLKLYLMLARPEKMDAGWFARELMRNWPQRDGVMDGFWQGRGTSLLRFYAASLALHPQWRLPADPTLASQARTLLIRQLGKRNSESTLYQQMLAQVANQYADMHLADMTGDTDASRLYTTDAVVPGMFTRNAWEHAVQQAIEKVVNARRDEIDWVLSDNQLPVAQAATPEALRERLAERYFADFSGAWLNFLNSLRWQRAATLSDAIDQLTLMADVRQSPLIALMNTLNVQGRTGQRGEAITDSLVKSAKNLFNREDQPLIDQQGGLRGPLDATFGPVLALMDNRDGSMSGSRLNLQTFLTRVTQVRLRLQQVTNAADPQAMTLALAQTVFEGRAVDLTDTRDYGSLVAAGLGQEWRGFGQTVFVRPMEQAWQQVLTPAAESLNARWRSAVFDDWNRAFGGRYPFKNVSSEVSLPLLAKYLNAESGRISHFLQTRLNGVLHKEGSRWVADSINAQGLTFNPAFLRAMNTLSHIADVAFTNGEAGMHFELRPGTAEGVMQTMLEVDRQKLNYMNQMPTWRRFSWPADTEAPGASLSWISTRAGTRQYADLTGAWGWIRLLDKATVRAYPGTGSSWSLSWKAPDGLMLNYTLRTEAGEGPLALLALRNFTLPETIFMVSAETTDSDLESESRGEDIY